MARRTTSSLTMSACGAGLFRLPSGCMCRADRPSNSALTELRISKLCNQSYPHIRRAPHNNQQHSMPSKLHMCTAFQRLACVDGSPAEQWQLAHHMACSTAKASPGAACSASRGRWMSSSVPSGLLTVRPTAAPSSCFSTCRCPSCSQPWTAVDTATWSTGYCTASGRDTSPVRAVGTCKGLCQQHSGVMRGRGLPVRGRQAARRGTGGAAVTPAPPPGGTSW